jgi:hypothetical protein
MSEHRRDGIDYGDQAPLPDPEPAPETVAEEAPAPGEPDDAAEPETATEAPLEGAEKSAG